MKTRAPDEGSDHDWSSNDSDDEECLNIKYLANNLTEEELKQLTTKANLGTKLTMSMTNEKKLKALYVEKYNQLNDDETTYLPNKNQLREYGKTDTVGLIRQIMDPLLKKN